MDKELILKGIFFHPHKPNEEIAGTLTYKLKAPIILETIGILSKTKYALNDLNFHDPIEIINGQCSDGRFITLLYTHLYGCHDQNTLEGFPLVEYHVKYMILGRKCLQLTDIRAKAIFLRFQYLDDWVNNSGFSVAIPAQKDDDAIKATIEYKQPEPLLLIENQNFSAYLYHRVNIPIIVTHELNIRQKTYLNIKTNAIFDLNSIIELKKSYQKFFSLAVSMPVGLLDCQIRINIDETEFGEYYIFFGNNFNTRFYPEYSSRYMLFDAKSYKNRIQYILENWINSESLIMPTLDLYFDVVSNYRSMLPKDAFLGLVQAIEIYCKRKAFENARVQGIGKKKQYVSLKKKFEALFNKYDVIIRRLIGADLAGFIDQVTNTRDHFNHDLSYDEVRKANLIKMNDLPKFIQKLKIIIQIIFLSEIGFEIEEIEKTIRKPVHNLIHFDDF